MTPEQQATWDAWLATMRNGWRFDAAPPSGAIESLVLAVDAELRSLRAALAASQAREAALREALAVAGDYIRPRVRYVADRGFEAHEPPIAALLADPSPLADALGRVVRASVAERQQARRWQEWCDNRSLPITADQKRRWHAFLLESGELGTKRRDAVDNLLAVAPHWGEPQGGG